jgi:O-antigen/teichoic acid export membrane protein
MVAYYVWPALAVALVAASVSWSRFLPVSIAVVVVTFAAQLDWRGAWGWWTLMVAGLAVTLYLARRSQPVLVPRPLASGTPLRTGALRAGDH